MDAQTHSNVLAALQSEAVAHARYVLMAREAREEGDVEAADLLEGIARVSLDEHFAELASLVGLVGGDADNLVTAIGEQDRLRETYLGFARQARTKGDREAAELFEWIRSDELDDVHALEGEVERLEVPS